MQFKKLFKKTTHIFHPNFDDEFYINEIIGIEEITYKDWSENLNNRKEGKNDKT